MWLTTLALATAANPKIINGEEEPGWPAVVSLGAGAGEHAYSACTGTIITPRLVLSAGHCGDGIPVETIVALGSAYVGTWVGEPEHQLSFDDHRIHPDYRPLESSPVGDSDLGAYDISVFLLTEPSPIAPLRFLTEPLDETFEGTEVLSVGYGRTESGGSGVKHSAVLTVDELDEMFLLARMDTSAGDSNICSGDSGGPQLLVPDDGPPVVVGVHSWGDSGCTSRAGSTRVAVAPPRLLEQVLDVHGSLDLCHASDRYGDGVCDEDCLAIDPDCMEEDTSPLACSAASAPGGTWLLVLLATLPLRRVSRSSTAPACAPHRP